MPREGVVSVHRRAGGTWEVRWREQGRNRSRAFGQRRDARAFDAEIERLRQLGPIGLPQLERGAVTIDEWVATGFADSLANVTDGTRAYYAQLYRTHIAPDLGGVPLRDVTVELLAGWQARLVRAGVGIETVRKSNTLIGSILQRAVEAGRINANPQRLTRKPRAPMRREVRPLAPEHVEALRRYLLDPEPIMVGASRPGQRSRRGYLARRGDATTRLRDATLIAVLAYAGLRPFEALRLTWSDVQERTLVINATKTGQRRSVRLLAPLAGDLAAWRLACGRPSADRPVFAATGGGMWTVAGYQSWRRRAFDPAAEHAGRRDATPYTLRHSFASLLLHEGRSVIYVARQLGHSATMTLGTYGHVIDELDEAPRLPAEDAIRAARDSDVRSQFAQAGTPHGS